MTRSSKRPERVPASLTPDLMMKGLPKLERRIEELKSFDVRTLRGRGDPAADAITSRINGTLRELLGHNTIEYFEHSTYSLDTLPLIMGGSYHSMEEIWAGYQEGLNRALVKIETLKAIFEERLADSKADNIPPNRDTLIASTNKVFLVHGHDAAVKNAVARFLEQLKLEPVILHEQTNEGKTIIEKFETNSSVAFAAVLLTPDDLGYPAGKPDMIRPRARQNVIMELGFFLGRLGRGKVAVLYKEGVEIPSDYQGVVFIPLDDGTGWHLQLARELKQAGLDVDLNRIISVGL